MRYAHSSGVDVLNSESYLDSFILNSAVTEVHAQWIQHAIANEPPPCAHNQKDVRENCQGWTIRVLQRLVSAGVVHQDWVESATKMKDPLK